jgi:hypothetical protein
MIAIVKLVTFAAAGAFGWLAIRALSSRREPAPHHALETWEGEGGNPAPQVAPVDTARPGSNPEV